MNSTKLAGEGPLRSDGQRVDATSARLRLLEQVRLLETNLPSVFFGTFLCIVAATFLDRLPSAVIWSWAVVQLTVSGWRLWTIRPAERRLLSADNVQRRLKRSTVHACLSGALWGTLGFLSISASDPVGSLIVVMMLTGLVGGATALVSHMPRVFVPYSFFAIMPAALNLQLPGREADFRWIGVMLLLFLVFSCVAARLIGRSVNQSIDLRLDNAALVDELRSTNHGVEKQRRLLSEALAREQQANLSKSRFLAAASHDLRQPLHALRLHTSTLGLKARGTPFERDAAMMGRSVVALDELFSAILDLSILDAGTTAPNITTVSLHRLLDRLSVDLAPLAAEQGLAFEIASTDLLVRTDPVLLERLLRNLLGNALRYTYQGSVRLELDTACMPLDTVSVAIIDTGIGIAEQDADRVFDEFVQLEQDERERSPGSGLGLSIVRRIARLLDMPLMLHSRPGKGTRVSLRLPLAQACPQVPVRSARASGSNEPAAPRDRTPPALGTTLLVVDDEAVVRSAMEHYLEERGYTVIAVCSGDEAIEVLQESDARPAALVCDYRLRHGERGTTTIDRLRRHLGWTVPALLMTGETGADALARDADAGSDAEPGHRLHVLRKPCDPDELVMQLTRAIGAA